MEISENSELCPTCLSSNRKMFRVAKYLNIMKHLLPCDCHVSAKKTMEVCWECYAFLRRAFNFRFQAQKANRLLRNGQKNIIKTLSSLTSVYKVDCDNISNAKRDSKIDGIQEELSDFDNNHDHNEEIDVKDSIETNIEFNKNKVEISMKMSNENKKSTTNKWAKKKLAQNKKPKFTVFNGKDMQVDDVFMHFKQNNIDKLKCRECATVFENQDSIIKHYRTDHKIEHICEICLTTFHDEVQYKSHAKFHSKYKCSLCLFSCEKASDCRSHLDEEHRQILQCIKCGLKFACRREFFQHFKEWHEKFICDYCGIKFKMKYCIRDHIRKQHSPFECKQCNKRFARYNGLWLHNKVKHTTPTGTAYCVECDKKYPDIYRYKWHLANSARHKPRKKLQIPCPDCDKVFSKNIYMKDHRNLVHLKQYKYRCEDCDKNYIRNADLVKHKKRVHDGVLPSKNKFCNMCGRGFSSNKILTNHLRTHTGERPYGCSSCPARFAQRNALTGHMKALHPTDLPIKT